MIPMKKTITGIAMLALAACGNDVEKIVPNPVTVPVCRYELRQTDTPQSLVRKQLGQIPDMFYRRPYVADVDELNMHGGYAGNEPVRFQYSIKDVLDEVNPQLWRAKPVVNIPDLHSKGIGSLPCDQVGTLTFSPSYDRKTGEVVHGLKYSTK
jgi:hypothetical protein